MSKIIKMIDCVALLKPRMRCPYLQSWHSDGIERFDCYRLQEVNKYRRPGQKYEYKLKAWLFKRCPLGEE